MDTLDVTVLDRNLLTIVHGHYMDAKEQVLRSEKELKDAREDCLRAGAQTTFGGADQIEVCNLRHELALRFWEQSVEEEMMAKDRLNHLLRAEVNRRRPGDLVYANDSAF
jgi:hypothetical protein